MRIPLESQNDVEDVMLRNPEITQLQHWSKLYSSEPHLAGDLAHAQRINDLWAMYGIPTKLVRYDVLQNFPVSASLSLYAGDGSIEYSAKLTEPELSADPTSAPSNGLPAFHGFSASGSVCAELVYANFGRRADFELLASRGISVEGKIVICKYGGVFRGLKVRAAEQYGAAAVIIYNDTQEDGEFTAKNGYAHYPDGPARHPESIQRGSVEFFGIWAGDPTTPGYPSLPGDDTKRKSPHNAIPSIPSLPISFADATPFLQALNGRGLGPSDIGGVDGDWEGALDDVLYYTGPSDVKVSLINEVEYAYNPIYNVIGTIQGSGEDMIVLGNHHDSWTCGAVDPVSASAAMNEVARGLGRLLDMGWVPERTIILASWDNEEYGLLGSTEWGEENKKMLSEHCVAYINVDESTNGGSVLGAIGSPLLAQVLRDIACNIPSPVSKSNSVYDDWLELLKKYDSTATVPRLGVMGTGSDYTVFLDHLGIPSLDMVFNGQNKTVYPYHSNYDSYHWVEKFGDVGFKKHLAMTQLWGALAVRLAGEKVIPFQASEYASELEKHVLSLKSFAEDRIDVGPMEVSVEKLKDAAKRLDVKAQNLREYAKEELRLDEDTMSKVSEVNNKYMSIEKAFLVQDGGLPGRPWFKHIIFAPGLWKGYDGVVFPGIIEALEDDEIDKAKAWVEKITEAIEGLAKRL